MTDQEIIFELKSNINEFDDYQKSFINSVANFYGQNGFITVDQREWLMTYYKILEKSIGD